MADRRSASVSGIIAALGGFLTTVGVMALNGAREPSIVPIAAAASTSVESTDGGADPPPSTASDAQAARSGAQPARVWWRADHDKTRTPIVSDRPGGDVLPGNWRAGYFCGFDSVPSWLSDGAGIGYTCHRITSVRDGRVEVTTAWQLREDRSQFDERSIG